jgi:uncharacterized protein
VELRDLGKTGFRTTLLGFGAMRIPDSPRDEAVATVRRAVELGINYIDTAPGYRESEEYIGEALDGTTLPEDLIISSKSHVDGDRTAGALRGKLERSLTRLRIGKLKFYEMWGVNNLELFRMVTARNGPLEGARKAQDEGLIDHIGLTTHAQPEDIITMLESGEFESVSLLHHILDRRTLPAIERAAELGIGVIHMIPLAQGMLANPSERLRADFAPYDVRTLALHYLGGLPQTSVILAGPKDRAELEANYAAVEAFTGWGAAEAAKLAEIEARQRERLGDRFCTACKACLPCPAGVNIPELLRINDLLVAHELEAHCRDRYAFMGNGGSWFPGVKADECTRCMECEPRCPEGLPIVEMIADLHERLFAGDRGRLSNED